MSSKTKWFIIGAVVFGIFAGTVAGDILRGEVIKWKGLLFNLALAAVGFYLLLFLRKEKGQEEADVSPKTGKKKKKRK
ncbi:MAG: hypothetical protein ACOWWO_08555 [Peptococcaceae bacterium]